MMQHVNYESKKRCNLCKLPMEVKTKYLGNCIVELLYYYYWFFLFVKQFFHARISISMYNRYINVRTSSYMIHIASGKSSVTMTRAPLWMYRFYSNSIYSKPVMYNEKKTLVRTNIPRRKLYFHLTKLYLFSRSEIYLIKMPRSNFASYRITNIRLDSWPKRRIIGSFCSVVGIRIN